MDLDEFSELDDGNQTKVPSRVPKFRPKSSLDKPLPKQPKIEESSKKLENLSLKIEPSVLNGTVKMEVKPVGVEVEVKPVPEAEVKTKMDERMDSNQNQLEEAEEDMIVREIDVYYTPSIDAATQVLCLLCCVFDYRFFI